MPQSEHSASDAGSLHSHGATHRPASAAALSEAAAGWAEGYGEIRHTTETQTRVLALAESLSVQGLTGDGASLFEVLHAADRIASAAMWLVVHQTYARNVRLDGRELMASDFKPVPEGHTGGSLNMVPAYVGYLAANAITGFTRSWVMGQGHCVSAIDSVNLLVDNMTRAHATRYDITDEGLTRYVRDFYSYRLTDDGEQESPLGSHVNPHTAGGMVEGGYLGFTELQYVHMPLPGERLVAFLSDGAFEEQRGGDWAPRWWRAADSGLVMPFMIKNGRRIDQRTTLSQQGDSEWFAEHLRLNSFDPIVIDGRDPAAFAWAVIEMEGRLEAGARAVAEGRAEYPVRLPYTIAIAPKGAGFYGAGTNLAHNLPLPGNPSVDPVSARLFNESASPLHVPAADLQEARALLTGHAHSGRPRERDHPLAHRDVTLRVAPEPVEQPIAGERTDVASWTRSSPMRAVDATFASTVEANPQLRPLVGNPDEMKSNRLLATLEQLRFRVTDPEPTVPEDIRGHVVTALNEEAVVSAALANKGGINLVHTYEAFGPKMHGAMRQEVNFAANAEAAGRPARWLSVPLILTSHTWENAKNEYSHQDPSMAELMLGELAPQSRVLFPPDANSAARAIWGVYQTWGQFWTLVIPKADSIAALFTPEESRRLLDDGALPLDWLGHPTDSRVVLTAIGAYQLEQVIRASLRLTERGVPNRVVYMQEPGRFRKPRTTAEAAYVSAEAQVDSLYPPTVTHRIFVTHTRPEPMLGALQPLNTGRDTVGLGFQNRGGTLDIAAMLFVNRCTWAHIAREAARLVGVDEFDVLQTDEVAALDGRANARGRVLAA